ncbi:hypothetical protein HDU67_003560 [Dinochytrium kinnereticum]|nr:hypothetical protein HDU67_003560 [Dinochytrium kinnereticum]
MQSPTSSDPTKPAPTCTPLSYTPSVCREWAPSNSFFPPNETLFSQATDATAFDAIFTDERLLTSTLTNLGCHLGSRAPVRYSTSFACSTLFEPCGDREGRLRLCRDICSVFYGDLYAVLRDPAICLPAVSGSDLEKRRETVLADVAGWCGGLKAVDGCLGGDGVDYTTCGFGKGPGARDRIAQFCAGPYPDPCCKNLVLQTSSTEAASSTPPVSLGPEEPTVRVAVVGMIVAFMIIVAALMILRVVRPWTVKPPNSVPAVLTQKPDVETGKVDRVSMSVDERRLSIANLDGCIIGPCQVDEMEGGRVGVFGGEEHGEDRLASLSVAEMGAVDLGEVQLETALCHARASKAFSPTLSDEIPLQCGDSIQVHSVFDDGWAYGLNKTTNQIGTFPVVAISLL